MHDGRLPSEQAGAQRYGTHRWYRTAPILVSIRSKRSVGRSPAHDGPSPATQAKAAFFACILTYEAARYIRCRAAAIDTPLPAGGSKRDSR